MSRTFSCIVMVLLMSGSVWSAEHTTDSLETVKKNVKSGKAVLVDVRETDEWKDGHVEGAKHLALSDLKKGLPVGALKKLLPSKGVIYLYCASGKRCLAAADILQAKGYEVRAMKEGFRALVKKGFPQEK